MGGETERQTGLLRDQGKAWDKVTESITQADAAMTLFNMKWLPIYQMRDAIAQAVATTREWIDAWYENQDALEEFLGETPSILDMYTYIEEAGEKTKTMWDDIAEAGKRVLEDIRLSFENAIFGMIKGTSSLRDFFEFAFDAILRYAIHAFIEMALWGDKAAGSVGNSFSKAMAQESGELSDLLGKIGIGGKLGGLLGGILGAGLAGAAIGGIGKIFGFGKKPGTPPTVTYTETTGGGGGTPSYPTVPMYQMGYGAAPAAAGAARAGAPSVTIGSIHVDADLTLENLDESAARRFARRLRDALEDEFGRLDLSRALAGAGA
jgi:hypothetical protein